MNYNAAQHSILSKLKHSMLEKQFGQKFTEIMNTNIRLNRDERATHAEVIPQNTLLPSISNSKIPIGLRTKSQSAKRLPTKSNLDKNSLQKSTKRLSKQQTQREQQKSNKKMDLQGLLIKKQSLIQQKQPSSIRSKLFSLKTPLKAEQKTISGTKEGSSKMQQIKKQISIQQFTHKIEQLNDELILTIRMDAIDSEHAQNKKIFNNLMKLKTSNTIEYNRYNRAISNITHFVSRYKIHQGTIPFKKIQAISHKAVLSNHQILHLFLNHQEIQAKYRIIGLQYHTNPPSKGEQLAANRITSFFKMLFSKRFYGKFKSLLDKVLIIQRYWRTCLLTKRTRRQIMQNTRAKLQRHSGLQKQLSEKWSIIKTSHRYEIHICSYSMEQFKRVTMKSMKQKENNQITRIFRALQTDVNVIYVSPLQLHQDIIKYYASIFNFTPNHIHQKLFFILPENINRFAHHNLTTASLLLYSPKALKRIRQIIGKQFAYIIPSFPSIEFINLSAELNVPVLSSNQNLMKLYSTKSGCLNILKNVASKEKPAFFVPKSIQSVFSQKQLINSLAVLIFKNKQIKSWYLKIEDEIHSRGLAYLNINKIGFLRQLCAGQTQLQVEDNQMIRLIAEELTNKLPHRLKIIHKDIYSDYHQFLTHFLTRGGIIQAGMEGDKSTSFSISFFIDPCGEFSIIGTYNKLQLGGKSINQSIKFPSVASNIDYQLITRNLYKQLWGKQKLFGFFTADFITSQMFILPYAIGLDCFLNQKTSSLFMVNFCCQSKYDKDKNCLSNSKNQDLHYIYCPSLTLLNLPVINGFFKSCKYENISYDLEKKLGTMFVLLDKLQNQQISLFCVQNSIASLLKEVKHIVQFFSRNYRESKSTHDQIGLLKGAVTTWLKKYQKQKDNQMQNLAQ